MKNNYYKINGGKSIEIVDIKGLYLSYHNIETFEVKSNILTRLNLSCNNLTSIDLSGLSHLQELYLSNNQINSIDLSELTDLQELSVENNKLNSIDLSELKKLQELYLSNNQLNSIDVNGLGNLKHLYLSNNQLNSIDLNGLGNLRYLYLSNNNLTSIDVSGLCDLRYLNLSNNNLTSIDVSGLSHLQELHLENNQIETLNCDLSRLSILCTTNIITDINNVKWFGVDGIPTKILSTKQVDEYTIYSSDSCYVVSKDNYYSHGDTIKDAIEDLNFKILQSTTNVEELVNEIKKRGVLTTVEYRLLTGACRYGVNAFKKEKNIEVDELPLTDVLKITKGRYGNNKLIELFS